MAAASTGLAAPPAVLTQTLIAELNEGKKVASDAGATITGVTEANLRQYLYDACWAVAKGELQPKVFPVAVRCAGSVAAQCSAELADVVWYLWLETEKNVEARARLVELVQALMQEQLVSKKQLLETGEGDFLEEAGIVVKAQAWRTKEIRVMTKHTYVQNKFNLLREESEGYAKLITATNRFEASALTPEDVPGLVEEIKSLIGYFDLDPNRVLNLVLQAAGAQPGNGAFMQLMPLFSEEGRNHVLGAMFQHHQGAADAATPAAMYTVAATLVQAEAVSLEAVLGHLAPEDEALKVAARQAAGALSAEVRKIGVISLTAKAADKAKQETSSAGLGGSNALTAGRLQLSVAPVLGVANAELDRNNQRLGLVSGLLQVGDWPRALQVMQWLRALDVRPAAYLPIAQGLCRAVGKEIAPSYAALRPQGRFGPTVRKPKGQASQAELSAVALEMLAELGMYACHDVPLVFKLLRLLQHQLETALAPSLSPDAHAEGVVQVEELLLNVVLPASMLIPANPAVAHELWGVLQLLPYTSRFRLYSELRAASQRERVLEASAKLASSELRKVLRRLHVPADRREQKEALRPYGRMLAKIAAANPLAVAQTIISQIEAYPNMIEPYVTALGYLTPLGFDVLSFAIIDRLASSGRTRLKPDGINMSDWLQYLATFAGHACNKYPEKMEIGALCQYVANQLKDRQGFDLLVLQELVAIMTGVVTVSDLSPEQSEAVAGGETLRTQVLGLSQADRGKSHAAGRQKLIRELQKGAPQQQLALPLMVLMAQQLQTIAVSMPAKHLKLIAEQYDKCKATLMQYVAFLKAALSREAYAALLPPLTVLVQQYGVAPDIALLAAQPIMAAIPPPRPVEEPDDGEIEEGQAAEQGEVHPAAASAAANGMSWADLVTEVRATLPASLWELLSPDMVIAFWTLTYQDVHVPNKEYEREISRLGSVLRLKEAALEGAERMQRDVAQYPGRMEVEGYATAIAAIPDLQKEVARTKQLLEALPLEQAQQQAAGAAAQARLVAEAPHWLSAAPHRGSNSMLAFLQHCIMPRAVTSPGDALFCTKFVSRLTQLRTLGWAALFYLDKVFHHVIDLVFCSTDREAVNIGIFLYETATLVEHWRSSEEVYNSECGTSPCFSTSDTDFTRITTYAQYCKLCWKWQQRFGKTIQLCLASKEYVQIRNALLVLGKLIKVFPKVTRVAVLLQSAVAQLREEEKEREDLRTQANMYYVQLTNQINTPGRMIDVNRFQNLPEAAKPATSGRVSAGKPTSPAGKAAAKPNGAIGAKRVREGTTSAAATSKPSTTNKSTPIAKATEAGSKKGEAAGGLPPHLERKRPGESTPSVRPPPAVASPADAGSGRKPSNLRPDAPAFQPDSGKRASSSGRTAPDASAAPDAERASKRLRTSTPAEGDAAAAAKAKAEPNGTRSGKQGSAREKDDRRSLRADAPQRQGSAALATAASGKLSERAAPTGAASRELRADSDRAKAEPAADKSGQPEKPKQAPKHARIEFAAPKKREKDAGEGGERRRDGSGGSKEAAGRPMSPREVQEQVLRAAAERERDKREAKAAAAAAAAAAATAGGGGGSSAADRVQRRGSVASLMDGKRKREDDAPSPQLKDAKHDGRVVKHTHADAAAAIAPLSGKAGKGGTKERVPSKAEAAPDAPAAKPAQRSVRGRQAAPQPAREASRGGTPAAGDVRKTHRHGDQVEAAALVEPASPAVEGSVDGGSSLRGKHHKDRHKDKKKEKDKKKDKEKKRGKDRKSKELADGSPQEAVEQLPEAADKSVKPSVLSRLMGAGEDAQPAPRTSSRNRAR